MIIKESKFFLVHRTYQSLIHNISVLSEQLSYHDMELSSLTRNGPRANSLPGQPDNKLTLRVIKNI